MNDLKSLDTSGARWMYTNSHTSYVDVVPAIGKIEEPCNTFTKIKIEKPEIEPLEDKLFKI